MMIMWNDDKIAHFGETLHARMIPEVRAKYAADRMDGEFTDPEHWIHDWVGLIDDSVFLVDEFKDLLDTMKLYASNEAYSVHHETLGLCSFFSIKYKNRFERTKPDSTRQFSSMSGAYSFISTYAVMDQLLRMFQNDLCSKYPKLKFSEYWPQGYLTCSGGFNEERRLFCEHVVQHFTK
jgi:hypothetical protein